MKYHKDCGPSIVSRRVIRNKIPARMNVVDCGICKSAPTRAIEIKRIHSFMNALRNTIRVKI